MTERLTQEQLSQIITEVQWLQVRRDAELDRQQVKEILQELNLPPELLDEALIQIQRRQTLKVQQRRNRWIVSGVVAVVAVAMSSDKLLRIYATTVFFVQQQNSLISRVFAQQDRITLVENSGNLDTISRQNSPEVFYRVTLKDAPVGKKLSLSCNWIDPTGQIVKQNRYQTREINTSIWDTYCRYTIDATAPVGNWQVQMFLEGRQISAQRFEVK